MEVRTAAAAAEQAATYTPGKPLAQQVNDYLERNPRLLPAHDLPLPRGEVRWGHHHDREAPRRVAGPAHGGGRGRPGAAREDRAEARLP